MPAQVSSLRLSATERQTSLTDWGLRFALATRAGVSPQWCCAMHFSRSSARGRRSLGGKSKSWRATSQRRTSSWRQSEQIRSFQYIFAYYRNVYGFPGSAYRYAPMNAVLPVRNTDRRAQHRVFRRISRHQTTPGGGHKRRRQGRTRPWHWFPSC